MPYRTAFPFPIRDDGLLGGAILACILYGILLGQIARYVKCFPKDGWHKKALVALVLLVATFDIGLAIESLRLYFVIGIEDPARWDRMSMCFALQQTKLCLGMLLAHVFFGKRLWMLTARRRWLKCVLVIAISVVALLGLSFGLSFLVWSLALPTYGHKAALAQFRSIIPPLWIAAAGLLDLSLTSGLIFALHRSHSCWEDTRLIVKRVIRLTIESMLLTHIITAVYTVLWCTSRSRTDAWWVCTQLISISYSLSIISTLNARKKFRGMKRDPTLNEVTSSMRPRLTTLPDAESGLSDPITLVDGESLIVRTEKCHLDGELYEMDLSEMLELDAEENGRRR